MEGLRSACYLKAIFVIAITSILFRCICATNHTVGGTSGWDLRSNIQAWSASTTFHVGDDLVFIYTPNFDVVEVNQLGYTMCSISNPIDTYDEGETVIHLTESGIRYFVCGRSGHCQQGLKLLVQVLAQTNNGTDDDDSGNQGQRRVDGGRSRRSPPRRSPPRPALPPPTPPRPTLSPPTPPRPTLSPPTLPRTATPKSSPPLPPDSLAPPPTGEGENASHSPAAGPCHCSGVKDGMLDALFWCHELMPLITLVIFFSTHPQPPFFLI